MPSASHRWCKRCHKVRVDKRAGLEMCQRCKRITMSERQQERRAVKARRALRAQAMGVAEMPTEDPEPHTVPSEAPHTNGQVVSRHQAMLDRMSPEIKREIGMHYEDRRIPAYKITEAYSISNQALSLIVDEQGIARRGAGYSKLVEPGHFERGAHSGRQTWVSDVEPPPVPEPVEKALERMLKPAPEPPVQRVRPVAEPQEIRRVAEQLMAPPPPTVQATVNQSSTVWEVQVEGLIHVTGEEIQDALDAVKGIYPRLRVRGIRQA